MRILRESASGTSGCELVDSETHGRNQVHGIIVKQNGAYLAKFCCAECVSKFRKILL